MGHGSWDMGRGLWITGRGSRVVDHGSGVGGRVMGHGLWVMGQGSGHGSLVVGHVSGVRLWVAGHGSKPCGRVAAPSTTGSSPRTSLSAPGRDPSEPPNRPHPNALSDPPPAPRSRARVCGVFAAPSESVQKKTRSGRKKIRELITLELCPSRGIISSRGHEGGAKIIS